MDTSSGREEPLAIRIAEVLASALPEAEPGAIKRLGSLLAALAHDTPPSPSIQRFLDSEELGPLLGALRGQTIHVDSNSIHFGDNAQVGDITIGTLAGRDVITLNLALNSSDITDVRGLPNPYLGLLSYDIEDSERYGGRRALAQSVAQQILETDAPLTIIVGPSGSGKSSFARAGVLACLAAESPERVVSATFTPGSTPLRRFAHALAALGISPTGPFAAIASIYPNTLRKIIPADARRVLLIDQFEELLASPQSTADASQFASLLSLLCSLPAPEVSGLAVLVTLRVDYLPELFAYPPLYAAAKQGIDLRAMNIEQLRDAILAPLEAFNRTRKVQKGFDPHLLAALASDAAGDPGALPLLQVTLHAIWQGGYLTRGAYSTLTDAFLTHAEQSVQQDSTGRPRSVAEQATVIRLLLQLVRVAFDDDPRRDTRIGRTLAEVTGGNQEHLTLVRALSQARIVRIDSEEQTEGSVESVHLIHETLLWVWPRLTSAIAAERELLRRQQRFADALALWQEQGRSDEALLSGVRLAEAQALRRDKNVEVASEEARSFIDRSVIRHAEEERRQRELAEQARREAEQRVVSERRAARQAQRLITALTGVVAVLLVAIGVAGWFGHQAQDRATLIAARGLIEAGQAAAIDDNRPALGLALTLEGLAALPPGSTERGSATQEAHATFAVGVVRVVGADAEALWALPGSSAFVIDYRSTPDQLYPSPTADARRLAGEIHQVFPVGGAGGAVIDYEDMPDELYIRPDAAPHLLPAPVKGVGLLGASGAFVIDYVKARYAPELYLKSTTSPYALLHTLDSEPFETNPISGPPRLNEGETHGVRVLTASGAFVVDNLEEPDELYPSPRDLPRPLSGEIFSAVPLGTSGAFVVMYHEGIPYDLFTSPSSKPQPLPGGSSLSPYSVVPLNDNGAFLIARGDTIFLHAAADPHPTAVVDETSDLFEFARADARFTMKGSAFIVVNRIYTDPTAQPRELPGTVTSVNPLGNSGATVIGYRDLAAELLLAPDAEPRALTSELDHVIVLGPDGAFVADYTNYDYAVDEVYASLTSAPRPLAGRIEQLWPLGARNGFVVRYDTALDPAYPAPPAGATTVVQELYPDPTTEARLLPDAVEAVWPLGESGAFVIDYRTAPDALYSDAHGQPQPLLGENMFATFLPPSTAIIALAEREVLVVSLDWARMLEHPDTRTPEGFMLAGCKQLANAEWDEADRGAYSTLLKEYGLVPHACDGALGL